MYGYLSVPVICILAVLSPVLAAPIHDAAARGDVVRATSILKANPSLVNAANNDGGTPMSIALEKGRPEVVKLLLQHNAEAGRPASVPPPAESIVFPKSSVPAKTMLHVNLLDAPLPTRFALTVLQGLVNREQPRIYITQNPGWHTPALIPKWMDGLRSRGYSFVDVTDPLSLVKVFRRNIKGAVLYESDIEKDPASLHKLNALTLYCALNDAVPLTEEMNAKLGLPVLLDARGKWNTGQEAYEWAYKELWPRANHNLLAFTCPSHVVLRDYLVENRVMPFWVSEEMDRKAEDICARFLDEAAPNSPVMGCWGGYGEKPAGRVSEANLQQWASERGKFVIVTDGCFDLSVHSGLTFAKPQKRHQETGRTLDPSKVYLCLNFTDGDNLQYIQQYFFSQQWWDNPSRGKLPLAWSINPSAADLMPDVLEYLISTCSANDELVCSTAGIGLASPSIYARRCATGSQIYDRYVRMTGDAMKRVGLTAVHLGDTSALSWKPEDFVYWAKALPDLSGILGDYGRMPGVDASNAVFAADGGVPVARVLHAPSVFPNADELANAIRSATPPQRPAFMHVSLVCWYNSPSMMLEALGKLGDGYVPVLPSEFFGLTGASMQRTLRFEFATDAEGWYAGNQLEDVAVRDGVLTAVTTGHDPYLIHGSMAVQSSDVKQVELRMKVGSGGQYGQFFFITSDSPEWDEEKSVRFDVVADGEWHEYVLPIAENSAWKGTVTGIRLDPTCLKPGIPVAIDYLRGE